MPYIELKIVALLGYDYSKKQFQNINYFLPTGSEVSYRKFSKLSFTTIPQLLI